MSKQETQPASTRICFGHSQAQIKDCFEFELDVQQLELRHNGIPVNVRPQAIQVLSILLQAEGRLVTTDDFRQELWGDLYLGWRNSLHQCMRDLRRALSDDIRNPRYVATVARLGYRFVGQQAGDADNSIASSGYSGKIPHAFRRQSFAFAAGFAAALLVPASFLGYCMIIAN